MKRIFRLSVWVYVLFLVLAPRARAIDSVTARKIGNSNSVLLIVRGAVPLADIMWEGKIIGSAGRTGFFTGRPRVPSNCIGELSDGHETLDVTVAGCTPLKALVERTGQTTSIVTGDDGDIQAGVKFPVPRFTVNGDGTVTDNLTGLIWLRLARCVSRTWADAVAFANNLADGQCGLTDGSRAGDWRLPNYNELMSLVDLGFFNPALSNAAGAGQWTNGDAFINVGNEYWSSTTDADDPGHAWVAVLWDGGSGTTTKAILLWVLAVRGGS